MLRETHGRTAATRFGHGRELFRRGRLLRRAAEALEALRDVRARYPEVQLELDTALGSEGTERLERAAEVIRAAADAVERLPAASEPPTP
jgi:hypothetical protein